MLEVSKCWKKAGRSQTGGRQYLCWRRTALEDSTVAGLATEFAKNPNKWRQQKLCSTKQKNIEDVFRRVRQKYWQVQAPPVGGKPETIFVHGRFSLNEDVINLSSFDGGKRDMLGR